MPTDVPDAAVERLDEAGMVRTEGDPDSLSAIGLALRWRRGGAFERGREKRVSATDAARVVRVPRLHTSLAWVHKT